MKFISLAFPILFFVSCGEDPILSRAEELKSKNDISTKSDSVKEVDEKQPMPTIAPPAVAPPTVAPPQDQPEQSVAPPPNNPKDGPFIVLEGSVVVDKWSGKTIKIDIFDGDQRTIGGERPSVIVSKVLESTGHFEIHLPLSKKELWIGASIDEDGDGRPGPTDPSGWHGGNPLSGQKNHSDISIVLDVPDAPNSR